MKHETYISGSSLGPIMCSQGGVPYNKEHIDHWRKRAELAESKLDECQKHQDRLGDQGSVLVNEVVELRKERDAALLRLRNAESALKLISEPEAELTERDAQGVAEAYFASA